MPLSTQPPLTLFGATAIIADDAELAAFYTRLFPLLLQAAPPRLCRVVGFEKSLPDGRAERFLGLDAGNNPIDAPELCRWRCTDQEQYIRSGTAENAMPLRWRWREMSSSGYITGEFDNRDDGSWRMTANTWIDPRDGNAADRDAVSLAPYNPEWPHRYELMAAALQRQFGAAILRLEHYGSTAIPGMPAKPIIDILMEVASFDTARPLLLPVLNRPDWEFWWYTDHMIFIHRDGPGGVRTHHLHIAPAGHRLWEGIAFRDYLRTHPEPAREYAELKQTLAGRYHSDREAYTDAKTELVRRITAQAQQKVSH
ncbi:MAG: GrpB family protein [Victivallales bacterium]|nr:GrpB family protein [Victivallales bacterium]